MTDAFSKYHPAVNFLFFLGAMGCGVVFQHPAYVLAGVLAAAAYYLLLSGRRAVKGILGMLPIVLVLALINPLVNTRGQTVLFAVFDRPYTLEALLYGVALAGMLLVMLLWFGCYNAVMTGDKFTSLFGDLLPSVSLLLVMVFRMVPGLIRKTRQITAARRSIGRGGGEAAGFREKLRSGMTVLSAMTSWALEGSLVTADSMRARGYGSAKRKSFVRYRMTARDRALIAVQLLLLAAVLAAAAGGQAEANFVPTISTAPVSWGVFIYWGYLLIPTAFHIKESIQWHISKLTI